MNYDEIVLSGKAYADRHDIEVDENFDTFIIFAEARMNRVLKTREQTARVFTPAVENASYYPLPPDYRGMRDVQVNSALPNQDHSVQVMDYISPYEFNIQSGKVYGGRAYYTIIDNQIQIYPCQAIGSSIEMIYYQKIPHLSEGDPNNWMSDEHPDIYLSGVMAEIELFVKNHDIATLWINRMLGGIEELDASDTTERWSGAPLRMRVG